MLNVTTLVQVKAFARQEAVFLALLWLASFLLMVYVPSSPWGSLMALSTPFFVGWRLNSFRDYALDGVISFKWGFVFSWYTFLYAALLFAIAQYVFFRYFDHGTFLGLLDSNIEAWRAAYKNNNMADDRMMAYMQDGKGIVSMMSPIQLSFVFMMQNLFLGTLLSAPVALFCKKTTLNT